jgi:hypothetical protein
VTWYGCWRGEFFEGCEPRCGEWGVGPWDQASAEPGRNTHRETQRTPFGFGVQQTRGRSCGANRRGGEKPRGRNMSRRLAAQGPNGDGDVVGEWTLAGTPKAGHINENESQERRIDEGRSGATRGALKSAPSP